MATLHIRFLRYSAFYTPLLLTLDPEFLGPEGLTATHDVAGPGRTVEAGLADGSVDLAQSAPAVSFAPAVAGQAPPFRHFALLNSRDGFFLAARRLDRPFRWAQVEEAGVVADHFFQPMTLLKTAMRRAGVDADRVALHDAGAPKTMDAAFRGGLGDFVHMQGPAPQQLEREGLARVVASIGAAVGPLAFSSLCALPGFLATEEAAAFTRAFVRAKLAAQTTPAAALAERLIRYFPETDLEVLAETIAAYQGIETWLEGPVVARALHERTVDIFLLGGHIESRPRFEDVFCAPPGFDRPVSA